MPPPAAMDPTTIRVARDFTKSRRMVLPSAQSEGFLQFLCQVTETDKGAADAPVGEKILSRYAKAPVTKLRPPAAMTPPESTPFPGDCHSEWMLKSRDRGPTRSLFVGLLRPLQGRGHEKWVRSAYWRRRRRGSRFSCRDEGWSRSEQQDGS